MPGVLPAEPVVAGERLGSYRLLRPISAGGMARVYEGRLESLAGVTTRVAIKVIHPALVNEPGFTELFIQEARVSARLEHPNLVRVQQFNREGSLYYLVMEYIEGVTFRKVISAVNAGTVAIDSPMLAEMGRQVCDGLAYAHALVGDSGEPLHLVHRDMKPSNMMLNAQGVAKLLDFGISYARDSAESAGAVKGTWGYMAPEQAAGAPVGPGADVFGLAVVLYELAARAPLFPEQDNATIRELLSRDEAARRAALLGGEWAGLRQVLVRALQRDPQARYRSAAAMGRALAELPHGDTRPQDLLVALVAAIRTGDGARPTASPEAAASISTMAAPAAVPLPVGVGSLNAPRPPSAAPARRKPRPVGTVGLVLSFGFAAVSVAVLITTVWKLFLSPRSAPAPRPLANPAVEVVAPVEAATDASTPSESQVPAALPSPAAPAEPSSTPAPVGVPSAAPRPPASKDHARRAIVESLAAPPAAPQASSPRPAAAAVAPATVAPSPQPAAVVGEGALSLGSTPRAQVTIDGAYVRFTPLLEYAVSAGEHVVLLVTDDGRRKTFRVTVVSGQVTQRVWNFDNSSWEDGGP